MPEFSLPDGRTITVKRGSQVAAVLKEAGIGLWLPCGGQGYCGRCRIKLRGNLNPPTEIENKALTVEELGRGIRLSCQARVTGDAALLQEAKPDWGVQSITEGEYPSGSNIAGTPLVIRRELAVDPPTLSDQRSDLTRLQASLGGDYRFSPYQVACLQGILREKENHITVYLGLEEVISLRAGWNHPPPYGAAVDVGTTTMVAYLWDLEKGERLGVAAADNPQVAWGDDVLTRIAHASGGGAGLAQLQAAVMEGVNALLQELTRGAGLQAQDILQVVLVGNTCMQHLFLGIDPRGLGQAPYIPAVQGPVSLKASQLGILAAPEAQVEFLPNIAAFVGSDALAAALWCGLANKPGNTLLVDLGTNGEILLKTGSGIVACSTAAGPAFEGTGLSCGARAVQGAVYRVSLEEGKLKALTLGGGAPRGICGSGLVDTLGAMLRLEVLELTGRILGPEDAFLPGSKYLVSGAKGWDFALEPGGGLRVTQEDVRKIQLAKGAVAAGIQTLLREVGLTYPDLDQVLLAGGFGSFIDVENAQLLGLLPPIPAERIRCVGNAAGAGAQKVLLSREVREEALELAGGIRHLDLAGTPTFAACFAEAMLFSPWTG